MRPLIRLLAVATTAVMPVSDGWEASAEGVYVGVCTLTVTVSFSSPVGLVPTAGTHGIGGSGTCLVNGSAAAVSLSGGSFTADARTGFGCTAGVGWGNVRFLAAVDGFPNPTIQLVLVNHGGVVSLAGYALFVQFEGAGELVQDAAATARCTAGTALSSATWTGAFAFQDPVLAP